MAALLLFVLSVQAQNQAPFRARYQTNETCRLNISLEHSDTIPLTGLGVIYALSIDATIYQPREASFTRIVLEDTNGHDYLVAESDWFRNDTTIVNLTEYCEETAKLNGIMPARLKCYLAADATISISGIHSTIHALSRSQGSNDISERELKLAQVQSIVNRINMYNERHGKLWCAGVTERSLMPYNYKTDEQNQVNTYLGNLQYYISGIYEIGEERDMTKNPQRSSFAPEFDWRNRHGRCWITDVDDQKGSGYCTAFAINGMLEARTNLYYNQLFDLDLSEQDIIYNCYLRGCYGVPIDSVYHAGLNPESALNVITNDGILDEFSVPFINQPFYSIPTRPYGEEQISISNFIHFGNITVNHVDSIKRLIINNGPLMSGIRNCGKNHEMTLVGYRTIQAGDTIHQVKLLSEGGLFKDSIIPDSSSLIGETFWLFKDNYGKDAPHKINGYLYVWFKTYNCMRPIEYTTSPIIRRGHTDAEIICEDRDGDGLFNWGIGLKPSHCPAWAPNDSDGDDSDPTKGHMNEYGFCSELPSNHPVYEYIANDSTLTNPQTRTTYLGILRGATVTFQTQQSFSNNAKLLLDNGATLILNGTLINGTEIQPYAGSKIILNNGARISKPFEVPVGVELIINQGSIE